MKETLFSTETRQFALRVCIILGITLIAWLLYTLQSILFLFGGAVFVALLLSPFVSYFGRWHIHKWKVPDALAICLAFGSLLICISLFVLALIPLFVDLGNNAKQTLSRGVSAVELQAQNNFPFLDTLPFHAGKIIRNEFDTKMIADMIVSKEKTTLITTNLSDNIGFIQSFTQKGFGQVSDIGISFASGITSTLVFVILFSLVTFLTLLERKRLLKWFFRTLPQNLGKYFKHRQEAIGDALHSWLKGQTKLVGLMFTLNFVGLWIISLFGVPVENIFALALIAGMMEFVPYVGPLFAWVTAFLMVLVSPTAGIGSLVAISGLYIFFQWVEGNIMVPMVMSRTLNLSPLYILLMTLVGATLGGMIGVLISVPLASILHIFYVDWMHYRKNLSEE
ncbi:MAG: AI-2E family transporter [Candidatus Gracilibacteria bacterium]